MLIMTMKRLQMNLKFLGFYKGNIDGIKGNQTLQAIKDYQKSRGLVVDGIAGQKTIDTIRAEIVEIQRQLGVEQDGVAGNQTINARDNKKPVQEAKWEDIKHFKKSEFTCKCGCGLNNMNLEVVKVADEIREHFNTPVIVTSGSRCEKHNAEVGGVANSRHKLGKAIDLYARGINGSDLISYTKQLENQGKLRYTYRISNGDCVHIDIR